ncbi:MAG: DUF4870 domain-containing protein [Kiritimatiellae bacterium]|nr:DUF4870 domain-containing protein [Kiritimatiellia bacterium]
MTEEKKNDEVTEQAATETAVTEEPKTETVPPTPVEEPAATPETPAMDEIEDGKSFAILSYVLTFIGIPFFLVPLIMRNNSFSLYHAKQCLLLALAGIVLGTISGLLVAVCIGLILLPVVAIMLIVFTVMGLMNAINGKAEPVPLIGKFAEDWFKGIQKV